MKSQGSLEVKDRGKSGERGAREQSESKAVGESLAFRVGVAVSQGM